MGGKALTPARESEDAGAFAALLSLASPLLELPFAKKGVLLSSLPGGGLRREESVVTPELPRLRRVSSADGPDDGPGAAASGAKKERDMIYEVGRYQPFGKLDE